MPELQLHSLEWTRLCLTGPQNKQLTFASVVLDGVLGPTRLERYTFLGPGISVVLEDEVGSPRQKIRSELLGRTENKWFF